MRVAPTPGEQFLHEALVARGIPHRRQPCIGGYSPGFSFHNKVLVELDGHHHFATAGKAYAARRTASLIRQGYRVLRFPNTTVRQNPEKVCLTIIGAIMKRRAR
jgi:very-short-patch-repair endonuclease